MNFDALNDLLSTEDAKKLNFKIESYVTENISEIKTDNSKLVADKLYSSHAHGVVRFKEMLNDGTCKVEKNGESLEIAAADLSETMRIVINFTSSTEEAQKSFVVIHALIEEPLLP